MIKYLLIGLILFTAMPCIAGPYQSVGSFFIDPYFVNVDFDYWGQWPQNVDNMCKRMAELGVAQTYEDANIFMWWGREDLKTWFLPYWVDAHKKYGLKYGFEIPLGDLNTGGPMKSDDWQRQQLEWLASHTDWDLSVVYLTYETGTAFFGAGFYASQIKLVEEYFKPQYYVISPYANSVGAQACKSLQKKGRQLAALTDAWIVIAPQDGVGAWNYPGAPYGGKCRDPFKCPKAFNKVVQMAQRLSGFNKKNDLEGYKVLFRMNAETFKYPALLASPERFNAQVEAYRPLLGVGPCWSMFPEQLK